MIKIEGTLRILMITIITWLVAFIAGIMTDFLVWKEIKLLQAFAAATTISLIILLLAIYDQRTRTRRQS